MSEAEMMFDLMGFTSSDRQALNSLASVIEKNIDPILVQFYKAVSKHPSLARMFSSPDRIAHAKAAQARHWIKLFSGKFDNDYMNSVKTIGRVHYQIGLNPEPYIAGYTRVIGELIRVIARSHKRRGFMPVNIEQIAYQQAVVTKAAMYDMQLAVSVYLDEEKNAKIIALQEMAEAVSSEASMAIGAVSKKTVELSQLASDMASSALAVRQDCQEVASASAVALENAEAVASATEELSCSIREISSQISSASQITSKAVDMANRSRENILLLSQSVARIGQVTSLITDIASQTNLLALNATIEAARAGDAGKGFAVVANEVKSLANQTAKATDEITQQIADIQNATSQAVGSVTEIVSAINDVNHSSTSIAAAVEEQGAATDEIARNVLQTKDVANTVANRISQVSTDALAVGHSAEMVSTTTDNVSGSMTTLRESIVKIIRTSNPEVDRRQEQRKSLARSISIASSQGEVSGKIIDFSPHGVRVKELGALTLGADCMLNIDGLQLRAMLADIHDGVARFKFHEDSINQAKNLL